MPILPWAVLWRGFQYGVGAIFDLCFYPSCCDEMDCTGSLLAAPFVVSWTQYAFLIVWRKMWPHLVSLGCINRLLSSALVRRFLRVVKDHGVALILLRLAHWASLSSTLSRDNLFDSITFVSVPTDDFANIGWHRRRRLCWVWWVCLWQLVTVNQPCSMIEVVWVTFAVQTTIAWTWVWQLLKQIFGQPEYVRDPCKCLCAFFARVGGFCLLNSTKFSEDSVIGPSRNYEDSRVAVMTLPNSSFSRSTMLREWGKRCASHGM